MQDPSEQERGWQAYHVMRRFAEGTVCRHRQICLHFSETPKFENCGACDICSGQLEWMQATHRRSSPIPSASPIPSTAPPSRRAPSSIPDSALHKHMREWRRQFARQRGVPAFMILTDASLADTDTRPDRT